MPASDGSDSVVEKEIFGCKSTRDVSNDVWTDGWVIVGCLLDLRELSNVKD
jgi:hypothetical protein